jgi:hypothetical protein
MFRSCLASGNLLNVFALFIGHSSLGLRFTLALVVQADDYPAIADTLPSELASVNL